MGSHSFWGVIVMLFQMFTVVELHFYQCVVFPFLLFEQGNTELWSHNSVFPCSRQRISTKTAILKEQEKFFTTLSISRWPHCADHGNYTAKGAICCDPLPPPTCHWQLDTYPQLL